MNSGNGERGSGNREPGSGKRKDIPHAARHSIHPPLVRFPVPGSRFPTASSLLALCLLLACNRPNPDTVRLPDEARPKPGDDPPVMINPESPVEYPPALYARGIEGNVLLRLHVDSAGNLAPDSTALAESSGYPALDTAALKATTKFRFAPALRAGSPVATTFLQPVHFRHSQAGGTTP